VPSAQVYRVRRQPAVGNADDVWHFTIRLSEPFAANQEVRTIPNGKATAASPWMRAIAGVVPVMNVAGPTVGPAAPVMAGNEEQRFKQATREVTDPDDPGYPTLPPVDLD